jgi:hypothetical protein
MPQKGHSKPLINMLFILGAFYGAPLLCTQPLNRTKVGQKV